MTKETATETPEEKKKRERAEEARKNEITRAQVVGDVKDAVALLKRATTRARTITGDGRTTQGASLRSNELEAATSMLEKVVDRMPPAPTPSKEA